MGVTHDWEFGCGRAPARGRKCTGRVGRGRSAVSGASGSGHASFADLRLPVAEAVFSASGGRGICINEVLPCGDGARNVRSEISTGAGSCRLKCCTSRQRFAAFGVAAS